MAEISDIVQEQIELPKSENSKLNTHIAIIVALSASLMALFNIQDNNIVQAMSQAQAHSIDAWSYYQSKSTKQHIAENSSTQLQLELLLNTDKSQDIKNKINAVLQDNLKKVEKYEKEKTEIKQQAENYEKEYEALNLNDDQFDLAEALISLGLSVLGITALTQKKPLFYFGLLLSLTGCFFGFAGFLGWSIHPEWLTKLLG